MSARTFVIARRRWTLALAASLALGACRRPTQALLSAEVATLERRQQGLKALISAAEKGQGRILEFDHLLVVVHQRLVQQVIDAALPFEKTVAGRYRIAAHAASVLFEDGFAVVRLDGKATLVERPVLADVTVHAGLDVVDLDPVSGVLRGRVKVYAVEARRVNVAGVDAPAEKLVEDLGRERLEVFEPLLSSIEIPVRLASTITLPGVSSAKGVRIEEAEVPFRVTVKDVKSFRHRLWVTVEAVTLPSPRGSS